MKWIPLQAGRFRRARLQSPRHCALRGFQLALFSPESPSFHYIHLAHRCVFMFSLLVLVEFVIYFSTFCPNIEVSLSKNLQIAARIVSLAACKVDRTDLLLLLPKIFNNLARNFLASGRRTFAIR